MSSRPHRWFLVLACVLTACGAKVVVERDEGAGGAGAGNGTGVGAGTGTGDGAYAVAACTAWCDANMAKCEESAACIDDCLELASYVAPCAAEYEAWITCKTDNPSTDAPCSPLYGGLPTCRTANDALIGCVFPSGACEQAACEAGGPDFAMECNAVCGGVRFTGRCGTGELSDPFPKDCTCQIDGETVGTCQAVTVLGLDYLGCCSQFFAGWE